jgi:hypothetical protein
MYPSGGTVTLNRAVNLPSVPNAMNIFVDGANFGSYATSPSVVVGSTLCASISWTTDTSIQCGPGNTVVGSGPQKLLEVTVSAIAGTAVASGTNPFNLLTYDAPSLHICSLGLSCSLSNLHRNAAASGGTSLTLRGKSFATFDATVTAHFGEGLCSTTSWTSSTTTMCAAPSGGYAVSPTDMLARLTVSAIVGTVTGTTLGLTFDAPVTTSASPVNGPTTGGVTITTAGFNFNVVDATPTVSVSSPPVPCRTSAWTTNTYVLCYFDQADGTATSGNIRPVVTVGAVVGTSSVGFSFDGTGACAAVRRGTCSTMIGCCCAQLRP